MPKRPKQRERQSVLPGFELPGWQTGQRAPAVRSRTSIAAAEAIERIRPTLNGRVYAAIAGRGEAGATREEISIETGLAIQCVCGRFADLRRLDLIYDTGTERTTKSGSKAAVMRARH
jgi:hypothetical protein